MPLIMAFPFVVGWRQMIMLPIAGRMHAAAARVAAWMDPSIVERWAHFDTTSTISCSIDHRTKKIRRMDVF